MTGKSFSFSYKKGGSGGRKKWTVESMTGLIELLQSETSEEDICDYIEETTGNRPKNDAPKFVCRYVFNKLNKRAKDGDEIVIKALEDIGLEGEEVA